MMVKGEVKEPQLPDSRVFRDRNLQERQEPSGGSSSPLDEEDERSERSLIFSLVGPPVSPVPPAEHPQQGCLWDIRVGVCWGGGVSPARLPELINKCSPHAGASLA